MFQEKNISKQLLKRLIALWFFASTIVGGIVSYIEIESIDNEVIELSMRQASSIDQGLVQRLPQKTMDDMVSLQEMVNRMINNEFVAAEVYDKGLIHQASAVRKDNKKLSDTLEKMQHQFPLDEKPHHEKFYVDELMYIQILVPLRHKNKVHGYFEGVYRVDQAAVDMIMSRVYHTLWVVLAVILATFIMLYPLIIYLNRQLISFSNDLFKTNIELMEVMGSAIAKRDSTTDSHNYRVTLYALYFAESLKLAPLQMSNLIAGSFLHDVGKIGIEDNILKKNGKLDEKEFMRMKEHVLIGVDIVAKADWLHGAREVIEFHHEKYDGCGYMRGLSGENIPMNARIFAIVDVFDALCSERPYKKSLPLDVVVGMMAEERGKHFDPELLDSFFELAPDLYKQIGQADYMHLTRMLAVAVKKYFFNARVE